MEIAKILAKIERLNIFYTDENVQFDVAEASHFKKFTNIRDSVQN